METQRAGAVRDRETGADEAGAAALASVSPPHTKRAGLGRQERRRAAGVARLGPQGRGWKAEVVRGPCRKEGLRGSGMPGLSRMGRNRKRLPAPAPAAPLWLGQKCSPACLTWGTLKSCLPPPGSCPPCLCPPGTQSGQSLKSILPPRRARGLGWAPAWGSCGSRGVGLFDMKAEEGLRGECWPGMHRPWVPSPALKIQR